QTADLHRKAAGLRIAHIHTGRRSVMRLRSPTLIVMSTAAMVTTLAAPMVCPAPAMAQASGMAGLSESDTISLRATVKSVDLKSRVVTLVGPMGNTLALKVSD